MKVHLLKNHGQLLGFSGRNALLMLIVVLSVGIKSSLWAEGSKDFVNYAGYRMFLDTRDPQQLKVYANAGETINLGSSHLGIEGGFIEVYDPNGVLVATFNNTGTTTGLGIINNNIEEMGGPTGGGTVNGTGYIPATVSVPTGMSGIWTVVFDYPSYSNASFANILNDAPWTRATNQPVSRRVVLAWDITVSQNAAGNMGGNLLEGRVYTNEHISLMNGNSTTTTPLSTSPRFHVLTKDGYLYRVNINEADPFRFPLSSNSFGLVDGNRNPIYKSKPKSAFTRSNDPASWLPNELYLYEPQAEDVGPLINNKIFFNPPNADLPLSAMVTDIFQSNTHETWLLDSLEILSIDSIYFSAQDEFGTPCNPGTIEFTKGGYFVFETNLGGVVTLQLDLNNNGQYGDPEDTTLMGTLNGGLDSLFWDGLNGLGIPIAEQDSFVLNYTGNIRFGELHIAMTDVEGNTGGVTFDWLNSPGGFPTDEFYYDHSDIDPNIAVSVSGGGTPGNALPTNIPYTYPLPEGNDDYIDQWFFIEQTINPTTIVLNVVLDCFCDQNETPVLALAGSDVCEGDALAITATNTNTAVGLSNLDYTWSGPDNFTFDDLGLAPSDTSTANVSNSATLLNSGTYQVIVSTATLCMDTAEIAITVNPTPVIETNQSNVEVCENGTAQFCASNVTPGIGALTCDWTGPNGFFQQSSGNGTDQICIDLTNVSTSMQGDYTLVCNANGCESGPLVFTLSVALQPEINGISPNDDFCAGENVELTASNSVAGTGPIIYTWTGPGFSFTDTSQAEAGPFVATIQDVQLSNAGEYVLVLESLAGCVSTAQSIVIGVNPNPLICDVSGGGDACVGQNVMLSASNCELGATGPISYVWVDPLGNNICSGTNNNNGPFECEVLDVQNGDSGTYCITITDDGTGCVSTQTCVDINVLPSINIIDVTPDAAICEGGNVTLSASTNFGADVVYTWTGPGGTPLCSNTVPPGTPLTCPINNITPADAGDYVLTVSSLDGCQADPVTVVIDVFNGVTITEATGGGAFCFGDTTEFSGSCVTLADSVIYIWTNPNGDTIGTGTTVPAGPFVALDANPIAGTYTLTVTTFDGCGDAATTEVLLNDTPVGNIITANDTTLCEIDMLVLCGQNLNPNIGDFTYTWTTPGGQTITGVGNGTDVFCDTLSPMSTYGAGTYTLVICSGDCCSDPVSININLNPNPVISAISGGGAYCEGDTAIVCFTNTNPAVQDWFYTCLINQVPQTGTGTGSNEICVEITEPATIMCSLESIDGCVSSLSLTEVTFDPNYTPDITSNSPVCENETLLLDGLNNSTCTGTVTYTWTGPGGFTFTGTAPCGGPFPAEDPNPTSGEYCLNLDAGAGANCSEPVCITVEVLELPFVVGGSINGGGEFCEGDTVELSAIVENPSGGDIFYELTQDGNVIDTGTVASGSTILYDLGTIAMDEEGSYCLNLVCTTTGCADEDLGCTQVTVNQTPTIDDVTGDGTYCQDDDVQLNGSGPSGPGDVIYTWTGPNGFMFSGGPVPNGGPYPATVNNVDVDDSGTYTLVVTAGDCVSDPATVEIVVNPRPDIINFTSGGEECEGTEFPLSFTIDPDGAASVDWTISGPGLNESGTVTILTDFSFDILVAQDMTFTITAVSDLGCEADPVEITITVVDVPIPTLFVEPTTSCPGETITLSTEDVPGATYTWFVDEVNLGQTTVPVLEVPDPSEGEYTVEVTLNGCSRTSNVVTVSFPAGPTANDDSFEGEIGTDIVGNILTNDDLASGSLLNVLTQPSNGTVTVGSNGEMVYTPDVGFVGTDQFTYELCLLDCPELCDDATVTIVVTPVECVVPNVITPDGDNVNDFLVIDCAPAFPDNRLRLFNRWGDEIEVFEPYGNTWDGTSGSSKDPVPAGTYFYIFQKDKNNDDHLAGYVKVVR